MEKVEYDMVYLAACGVNNVKPAKECLKGVDIDNLYRICHVHMLDALVGMTLKKSNVTLPKLWEEKILKAVRKNILFDGERKKLFGFMEENGIWYMPLKGIVMKDFYPEVGMRQMSDNDILFDADYSREIEKYMKSQGYEAYSVGHGNHDVYRKKPVYNFEMHRALYNLSHNNWENYYRDVKKRLIRDNGSSYGYHFCDEDFYVYIVSHACKHYSGYGTGLRTLLDFYVYLGAKEREIDFDYIKRECKVLEIDEFEESNRRLCKKVFSATDKYDIKAFMQQFSSEEKEMLSYYFTSGVYGTTEGYVTNMVRKKGRMGFLVFMIFKPLDDMKFTYPVLEKIPVLLPVCWIIRIVRMMFSKEKRKRTKRRFEAFLNYNNK